MSDIRTLLERQVDAFNRKSPELLGQLLAEDYCWYVVDESGPKKAASGRAETMERMRQFFAAQPYSRSRMEGTLVLGNIVAAVEKDSFEQDGRTVERTTLGVYEYENGKLKRAWAFPVRDGTG